MTFTAPIALGIAAAAALGVVLWHLIATQRPQPAPLPTARFVPSGDARAASRASRPSDLLVMALRLLAILSLGAAFAGPRWASAHTGSVRVFVADASRSAETDVGDSVRARWRAGDRVVWFDSAAHGVSDSLGVAARAEVRGRLSAGLARAHRVRSVLAERSDSIELVIVSPLAADEVDAATALLTRRWPGRVVLVGTRMRTGPRRASRIVAQEPTTADSAAARDGVAVIWWPAAGDAAVHPEGVWIGEATAVAPLARLALPIDGRTIARWADGTPAAGERSVGNGCIRRVGIGVPRAGDTPLQPAFAAVVAALQEPCVPGVAAATDSLVRTFSHEWGAAAAGSSVELMPSMTTLALLIAAVLALIAEMFLRVRRGEEP